MYTKLNKLIHLIKVISDINKKDYQINIYYKREPTNIGVVLTLSELDNDPIFSNKLTEENFQDVIQTAIDLMIRDTASAYDKALFLIKETTEEIENYRNIAEDLRSILEG